MHAKSVCIPQGVCMVDADMSAQSLQPASGSASPDVSKFLPKHWGAWLESDAVISSQAAHSHLYNAGAATAKVLSECRVLSNVLRDEINKMAAQLEH